MEEGYTVTRLCHYWVHVQQNACNKDAIL